MAPPVIDGERDPTCRIPSPMKSRPESSAGREGEKSAGGVMLAEAGGIAAYLFVLSISLISRRGFYAPPLPEEIRMR